MIELINNNKSNKKLTRILSTTNSIMSTACRLSELLDTNLNSKQPQQINKNSIYQAQYKKLGVQIVRAVRV